MHRAQSLLCGRGRSLVSLAGLAMILAATLFIGSPQAMARDRSDRDRHHRRYDSHVTFRVHVGSRYCRPSFRSSYSHSPYRFRSGRDHFRSYRYSSRFHYRPSSRSLVFRCGHCHRVHSRHYNCRRDRHRRSFDRHHSRRHRSRGSCR